MLERVQRSHAQEVDLSQLTAAALKTLETLALSYYFSNRLQEARPLLETVAGWKPADTYVGYALAIAHAYARDWDAARRTFARLFDIPPGGPEALVLTAHFLTREKFVAEAEQLIREAQKKRPELPDLNYRLGLIALTNGDLAEALKHLQQELAGNPIHPMAWHYLGEVYLKQGKPEEAAKALQRAIWLNLRSVESYVLIASAYMQQGKYSPAEQALHRALELAPQSYEAHFQLGRLYHKTNRPELAKKEIELANRLRNASRQERRHLYASLYDEMYRRVPLHPQLTRKSSPEETQQAVASQMKFIKRFLSRDATFLEIGAGDCALSFEVARRVKRVYAVDVSDEITRHSTPMPNFQLILSDGSSVPLPPNCVDVAYSNQLMEHLHPDDAFDAGDPGLLEEQRLRDEGDRNNRRERNATRILDDAGVKEIAAIPGVLYVEPSVAFGAFVRTQNPTPDANMPLDVLLIRMSNSSAPNPMGIDNLVLRR